MSKFREKVQGITKQTVGQMIGDDVLAQEGREQQQEADRPTHQDDEGSDRSSQGITRHQNAEERPIGKERAQTAHRSSARKSASREATRDPKLTDAEKTPGSGVAADDDGDPPTG
jgi:uncharacterized protein YjbJ (UPF0337 family)